MGLVLLIWLAGVASSLSTLFCLGATIALIGAWVIYGARYANWADTGHRRGDEKPVFKITKIITIWALVFMFIGNIIPDKKTTYWMAGAYVGSQIVQSETAGKVVDMINVQIDKYIKEMQQEETPAKNDKKESK